MSGRNNVKEVRLPTEAEWEYACRAGTETQYHFGNVAGEQMGANFRRTLELIGSTYAFGQEARDFSGNFRRTPVRSYPENGFGLFDMHGNVLKWCRDGYRNDYEKLEREDPIEKPSSSNVYRVVRGEMSASRRGQHGGNPTKYPIGFRVVVLP